MVKLGLFTFARAGVDLVAARLAGPSDENGSFESFALRQYGRTIAEAFLLDYSKKLWGLPCDQLSPSISGRRLKGLNFKTFLKETFQG